MTVDIASLIIKCCRDGDLDKLKELFTLYSDKIDFDDGCGVMYFMLAAYYDDNLEMAKWIYDRTPDEFIIPVLETAKTLLDFKAYYTFTWFCIEKNIQLG